MTEPETLSLARRDEIRARAEWGDPADRWDHETVLELLNALEAAERLAALAAPDPLLSPDRPAGAALRLARARQYIAANGGGYGPPWDELTDAQRAVAELEARHWLQAADNANLTGRWHPVSPQSTDRQPNGPAADVPVEARPAVNPRPGPRPEVNPHANVLRLWEAPHDGTCEPGNYHAPPGQCSEEYRSWSEFFAEYGDRPARNSLLFRWDWRAPEHGVMGELELFYVGQYKAQRWSAAVSVHPDEEPLVRAYLQPRLDYLAALWAPLTPGIRQPAKEA